MNLYQYFSLVQKEPTAPHVHWLLENKQGHGPLDQRGRGAFDKLPGEHVRMGTDTGLSTVGYSRSRWSTWMVRSHVTLVWLVYPPAGPPLVSSPGLVL